MQSARDPNALDQLSLFHNAWMASRARMAPLGALSSCKPRSAARHDGSAEARGSTLSAEAGFSEIALNGSPRQCLQWLAPVLRELSHSGSNGWLTLLDPPAELSLSWLRSAELDASRILIIRSRPEMDSLDLCCDVLREGKSHTVVSWLAGDARETARLSRAASDGNCASLNIRLQATRVA